MLLERLIAIIDPSQSILEAEIANGRCAYYPIFYFNPSHSCAHINQYDPTHKLFLFLTIRFISVVALASDL